MRYSTVGVMSAAAALLVTGPAHAAAFATTDPVGDARRVHHGVVTESATGDSDITGVTIRKVDTEGDRRGIRVRIQVREIDRSSNARSNHTGLWSRTVLTLDTGLRLEIEGQPRGYAVRYRGDQSCFAPEDELSPIPELLYHRYSDTVTMTVDGGCYEDAETAEVKAVTTLVRKDMRLTDRAVTGVVAAGDSGDES